MTKYVQLSWVNDQTGYQITGPMTEAHAQSIASELKRRFPLVHETLTIHPCEAPA